MNDQHRRGACWEIAWTSRGRERRIERLGYRKLGGWWLELGPLGRGWEPLWGSGSDDGVRAHCRSGSEGVRSGTFLGSGGGDVAVVWWLEEKLWGMSLIEGLMKYV